MTTNDEVDLFGQSVRTGSATTQKGYAESNDMEIVQHVIVTAMTENGGYALVGSKPRVFHLCGGDEVEAVPSYEAAMVCQLLDRKVLNAGGVHTYTHGAQTLRGRSVLVPKSTASMARRWRSLVPIPAPRGGGAGHVRDAATGRPARARGTRRTTTRTRKG